MTWFLSTVVERLHGLNESDWRLITSAAAIGAATTLAIVGVSQSVVRRSRVKKLKNEFKSLSSFPPIQPPPTPTPTATEEYLPEELIREQLSRNYSFLGEEGMKDIRNAFVIVVGLGGVGSHAVHMLARAGVGRIRVIDFDQVSLSSLNRHALAVHADVGSSKATVLATHLKLIARHVRIEPVVQLFDISSANTLLEGQPNFVLDCIDNLNTKIDLIKYCLDNHIKIISSMGAGAKADPSRIQIADISDTFEDPLARATRQGLKKKGVDGGIPVVYSTEKPGKVKLLPMEADKEANADEYAILPNFRSRILPVLGTIPALFGMAMASYVICKLANFEMEPLPIKGRFRTYEKILINIKKDKKPSDGDLEISVQDVGFVLEEVWFGKSALSGSFEKEKVTLTRWDISKPWKIDNLVCLTRKEAEEHSLLPFAKLESHYGKEFVDKVNGKLQSARELNKWRE
ncbi:hypothetical protein HK100_007993 [Physocladia obscura]|uniref:THIF-type NAD/FAD binding fold domain-containing protein n=1 Tax=Physocladia obscura TaxID=109957 RepID=A0AAD5X7Z8_9FUNG|nr:hypothetical protein HK100_007993 [Physocladia obscura]